jgi:rhomboid family GlyGly-CTERM serine protease
MRSRAFIEVVPTPGVFADALHVAAILPVRERRIRRFSHQRVESLFGSWDPEVVQFVECQCGFQRANILLGFGDPGIIHVTGKLLDNYGREQTDDDHNHHDFNQREAALPGNVPAIHNVGHLCFGSYSTCPVIIANEFAIPVTAPTDRVSIARSLNGDGRFGIGLMLTAALVLLPLLGGEPLRLWGRYDRVAIAAGQWWRWVTAHLMHLDATHAVLNTLGLALLWALFARSYRLRDWLLAVVIIVTVIDLGFWFFSPTLEWYVGASAMLHGVFACGCLAMIRQRDRIGVLAGAIFLTKIAWEQWQGPLPFERTELVVTISHLYGAIGGVLAGALLRARVQPVY